MNLAANIARTALLTTIGLALAGCAGEPELDETLEAEQTEEAESELVNGTTTTDHAPVVRIQNSAGELCTATAIADDLSNSSTSSVRDFKIVHPGSGKCMDLSGGSSSDGTQIQIWTCSSTNTNQNFALKHL